MRVVQCSGGSDHDGERGVGEGGRRTSWGRWPLWPPTVTMDQCVDLTGFWYLYLGDLT